MSARRTALWPSNHYPKVWESKHSLYQNEAL
jgi:hypothetical protein